MIMKFAADEEFYPVRRRGEKRRLNPNRAAIEWLENDTSDLLKERSRYLMSDTGGRYGIANDTLDDLVLVTKAYGAIFGTHHNRPMFECFGVTENRGMASYPNPCPDCDNLAYSPRECGQHAEAVISNYVSELNRITAPTVWVHVDGTVAANRSLAARERIITEQQAELYAMMIGVDGSEINISWRVNPA